MMIQRKNVGSHSAQVLFFTLTETEAWVWDDMKSEGVKTDKPNQL